MGWGLRGCHESSPRQNGTLHEPWERRSNHRAEGSSVERSSSPGIRIGDRVELRQTRPLPWSAHPNEHLRCASPCPWLAAVPCCKLSRSILARFRSLVPILGRVIEGRRLATRVLGCEAHGWPVPSSGGHALPRYAGGLISYHLGRIVLRLPLQLFFSLNNMHSF